MYRRYYVDMKCDEIVLLADKSSSWWKTVFANKFFSDYQIRLCQRAGWKFRTCCYVGCLEVLKSAKMMERHVNSHQKKKRIKPRSKTKTTKNAPVEASKQNSRNTEEGPKTSCLTTRVKRKCERDDGKLDNTKFSRVVSDAVSNARSS
mmetsp:Transcript_13512/g.20478  ORF Transcript_13512/g.20478 Transcript_13512/m.20478 type:complete len:148 (-) Transcript_13512:92-535(-)